MELDPSLISIWSEYFCRYDESKKENMTLQMQNQEAAVYKIPSIEKCQESMEYEISQLLVKL